MILKLFLLAAICLFPLHGVCGIYGYVDEGGVFHFTNIKPANNKRYKVVVPDAPKPSLAFYSKTINADQYDSLIYYDVIYIFNRDSWVSKFIKYERR